MNITVHAQRAGHDRERIADEEARRTAATDAVGGHQAEALLNPSSLPAPFCGLAAAGNGGNIYQMLARAAGRYLASREVAFDFSRNTASRLGVHSPSHNQWRRTTMLRTTLATLALITAAGVAHAQMQAPNTPGGRINDSMPGGTSNPNTGLPKSSMNPSAAEAAARRRRGPRPPASASPRYGR
jgi:hypothetical protein